ncbi:MAG: hypothetical protein IJP69_00600 [Synergistaceae bacterium]|nr:hypothetical protein [Synergistaceae bacterium]
MNVNKMIRYNNYVGSVEFSETDGVFYGKVQGINSLISYEGTTISELIDDFHGAVDDYIELCKDENIKPEISNFENYGIKYNFMNEFVIAK